MRRSTDLRKVGSQMKFFRKKLKPAWTLRTDMKVWRLLPSSGVLAAELRDTDAKLAEYSGIDINSGAPLWQGLRLEDSWWVIMNTIYRDVLLLHQFVKPDMPTPGKIFAVDLFTGKILWENHELSYLNAAGDVVFCLRSTIQSEEVVGIDYRTGSEKFSFSVDDPRTEKLSLRPAQGGFILPAFIEEIADDITPERLTRLRKAPPGDARNPTFIPAVAGNDVIGFHSNAGTDEKGIAVFDSHVMVFDGGGKVIFEDIADRKVYTAMSDFYFVAGENLIYVRDSKEIVAVRLGQ